MAARTAAGARADAAEPADEQASRREILQRTTLALFALPEPYQTTLLQRYFEGLSPSAIARREGISVATVKSRQQRGLQLLRATLDRREGDKRQWRKALLLATGYGGSVATVSLTTGTTLTLLIAHSPEGSSVVNASSSFPTFGSADSSSKLMNLLELPGSANHRLDDAQSISDSSETVTER